MAGKVFTCTYCKKQMESPAEYHDIKDCIIEKADRLAEATQNFLNPKLDGITRWAALDEALSDYRKARQK